MAKTRNQKRKNTEDTEDNEDDGPHKFFKNVNVESESKSYIDYESESESESETESESESETKSETENYISGNDNGSKLYENLFGELLKNKINKFLNKKYNSDSDSDYTETNDSYNSHYNKFLEYIESIHNGEFFEHIAIENRDKKRKFKQLYDKSQVQQMNEHLEKLQHLTDSDMPNISDILNLNVSDKQKQKLLQQLYLFTNSDPLSPEYFNYLSFLQNNLKQRDLSLLELEKRLINENSNCLENNYRDSILKSIMSYNNKVVAFKHFRLMESYTGDEYIKYKNWLDLLLKLPWENRNENKIFDLKNTREILDKNLSFLEKPKDQIINIISQMKRNSHCTINAIGIYGVPGVGKSSIIKSITEALNMPLATINLGGSHDSADLLGHGFTYIGSKPGRLIEILGETQSTNVVIAFDELDKISKTEHSKEIIASLIHITDTSTNNKFNLDKYFSGIEFDLSKCLFIFTYNDPSEIDPILLDRLHKIKIDNYTIKEKFEITKTHLIKNALKEFNFTTNDITFTDDCIDYISNLSQSEDGVRNIKKRIEIIISRINTLLLTNEEDQIIKLKYKILYKYYNKLPLMVHQEHIDIFLSDMDTDSDQDKVPFGMYM